MLVFVDFGYSSQGDVPTPEQIANWTRRMSPPENEVPGAVPWSALLGRSTDVAVALVGARAYSTGIQLGVAVRIRQGSRRGDFYHEVLGYPGGGVDRLLLGVEYADGRVATNAARGSRPPQEQRDDEPLLLDGGSGGSDHGVDVEFFLSPPPPEGPLTIFCAWPSQDIPETRTLLDGAALAEAVKQVQVLWPRDVDPPPEPAHPPRPNVPQGGWFEGILRPDQQQ